MQSSVNPPVFPQFKLIELRDKNHLERFAKKYLPYSDFNFVILWIYNTGSDMFFSWLNNNLVIRFHDYITKDKFYSFMGDSKAVETIDTLLKRSKEEHLTEELKLIPERNIANILPPSSESFFIKEDEDHNDYIISFKDTINLSNINPHKQKAYSNFIENYPNYKIRNLNITDHNTQNEMLTLFSKWKVQKKMTIKDADIELSPLLRLFNLSTQTTLFSLGLYIDDELCGFIIDERVQKPYVIGHFIKADLSYLGIYEVLNKVSAEIHYKDGYKFINIEQDLGILGLRISKKQRNPVKYLKKYIIRRK